MEIKDIDTPRDILSFMKENIRYGWIGTDRKKHIKTMKDFRRLYRTSSLEDTLRYGLGTCIEQVFLMHHLLDTLRIPNKMFCTRVYEGRDFNKLDEEEHMHCFVLYYLDDKVYQIEHPNWERVGIYEFNSEEDAINKINGYYVKMANGRSRPVTEFFDVQPGLSFKEFNGYINSLDEKKNYVP